MLIAPNQIYALSNQFKSSNTIKKAPKFNSTHYVHVKKNCHTQPYEKLKEYEKLITLQKKNQAILQNKSQTKQKSNFISIKNSIFCSIGKYTKIKYFDSFKKINSLESMVHKSHFLSPQPSLIIDSFKQNQSHMNVKSIDKLSFRIKRKKKKNFLPEVENHYQKYDIKNSQKVKVITLANWSEYRKMQLTKKNNKLQNLSLLNQNRVKLSRKSKKHEYQEQKSQKQSNRLKKEINQFAYLQPWDIDIQVV